DFWREEGTPPTRARAALHSDERWRTWTVGRRHRSGRSPGRTHRRSGASDRQGRQGYRQGRRQGRRAS
ncbi:hypothetical protein AAVH_19741, partial [Aphelenchoides avenae]